MNANHRVFLVEDDEDTAKQMQYILCKVGGYDLVHAATLEQARPILEEGGFCIVLLDQNIPRDGESAPHVEIGRTLLSEIRTEFPKTRADTPYRGMPIVIVSGHAQDKESRDRVDPHADLVIEKTEPKEQQASRRVASDALLGAIKRLLEQSGRTAHSLCAQIEGACRRSDPSKPRGAPSMNLVLTSRVVDRNTFVELDGESVPLLPRPFEVLLLLARARAGDDKPVQLISAPRPTEMSPPNTYKAVADLKKALGGAVVRSLERQGRSEKLEIIENHRDGSYELAKGVAVQIDEKWGGSPRGERVRHGQNASTASVPPKSGASSRADAKPAQPGAKRPT